MKSFKLRDELIDKIKKEAKKQKRSVHYIVIEILEKAFK